MDTRVALVLHIITDLGIGGAERLVVSAARGLPRDRYQSAICCLTGKGPLAREAEAAGVPLHCVGAFPGLSNPLAFSRLMHIVGAIQPAIVHTHLQAPNLYGRLAACVSRVPIVVATEHNVYTRKAKRYVAAERLLARRTDALVAVSSQVQQFLSGQLRISEQKIRVIRNGVARPVPTSDGVDSLTRLVGSGETQPRLATVASLTPKKGHEVLLRALARLRNRGLNPLVMLAGEGPERRRLEALAAELQLAGSVHFLGAVDNPADVLEAADIFVLPSLVEGLPLALLEAMRAGKAVVATAVGGVPEAIDDGRTGVLVAPGNEEELAIAIGGLASAPLRRIQLGEEARKTADRLFTEHAYVTALAALYDDLLAR